MSSHKMLRKNRGKRHSSDKHSGPTIASNLEYSIVSRIDAMELEKVLTMDHEGGSSAGVDDGGEPPDFRYFAWLLREKVNVLVNGNQGEPPELELGRLLKLAVSHKIISVDPKMLNPVLWGILPTELLSLVFARLPVPDITRLRSLSKEWNKDMAIVNSEFNQACDENSPMKVGGISQLDIGTVQLEFHVTICTPRSQYSYWLHLGDPIPSKNRWNDMGALHGGLACFVSTWKPNKAHPLCIVVVNLLTRVQHKLSPRQYVYLSPPEMMHIEVDSETKCYRVVVVDRNRHGCPTVEIYHSSARRWTKETPFLGSIFGEVYSWEYNITNKTFRSTSSTRCVYDFAGGQLDLFFSLRCPCIGASILAHVIRKDCMFVLYRNESEGEMLPVGDYCITKYHIQTNAAMEWVRERSYSCSPFEPLLEMKCCWLILEACENFLVVFEPSFPNYRCELFWLLDLSTREWSSLPNCFDEEDIECGTLMTQTSYNVVS